MTEGSEILSVVCFSGGLFDMFPATNRQRVMSLIARQHRVLYIEQPKYFHIQLAKFILGIKPEQSTHRWFRRLFLPEHKQDHLYLYSLIRFAPLRRRSLRKLTYLLNISNLRRAMRKIGFEHPVVWVYTPDAVVALDELDPSLVIYDCVDQYAAQPWYSNYFKDIEKDEEELLARADLVFTTSPALYELKSKYNHNTYYVGNPGDYSHFIKAMSPDTIVPPDIQAIPKPIIGFVGAIDEYKLDVNLLAHAAESRPDLSFVLIGPLGVVGKKANMVELSRCPNVHLLGPRKYEELPNYIKGFDVCIIPYVINEYTKGCFPLKFFEFMASGKPIVVSNLPALQSYREYIWITDDLNSFIDSISAAIGEETPEKQKMRLKLAQDNTWEAKTDLMLEIIFSKLRGSSK